MLLTGASAKMCLSWRGGSYCAQIDGFGTDSSCVAAFVSKCGVDASDCRVIESCGEAFSVCYGKQNEFYGNSMGGCDAYDLGFCDLRACVDNGAFNLRSGSANTEFMDFNLLGTIPEAIAVLSDVTSVDFKEVCSSKRKGIPAACRTLHPL